MVLANMGTGKCLQIIGDWLVVTRELISEGQLTWIVREEDHFGLLDQFGGFDHAGKEEVYQLSRRVGGFDIDEEDALVDEERYIERRTHLASKVLQREPLKSAHNQIGHTLSLFIQHSAHHGSVHLLY